MKDLGYKLGTGIIGVTTLLNSYNASSQNTNSIPSKEERTKAQQGIMFQKNVQDSGDSLKYTYPLNKYLQNAVKAAGKPYLILQDVKGRIEINEDKSELYVTIPKSELGKVGIIGVGDKSSKYTPCEGEGLGSVNTPLSSFATYFGMYVANPEEFSRDTIKAPPVILPGDTAKAEGGKTINTIMEGDTYNDNRTIIYGDTTKCHNARLRAFLDGSIMLDKAYLELNPQIKVGRLGNGTLWTGPYGRGVLSKQKTKTTQKNWNETELLDEEAKLYSNSTGFEKTTTKEIQSPLEIGWNFSWNLKKWNFDLFAGVHNYLKKISTLKKGEDKVYLQNGDSQITIDSKPFCVEDEIKNQKLRANLGIRVNYEPLPNFSTNLEASLKGVFLGASIEFGGCNKK